MSVLGHFRLAVSRPSIWPCLVFSEFLFQHVAPKKRKWKMMNMGVYLICPNNCMSQCFRERTRELSIIRNMKPDSLGLTHSFTLLESLQFQKEHWDTGSRLLLCGSMQLAAFTYTFLLSWRRLGIRGMQCGRLSASDRENIECDICGKQQPTCG